MPRKEDKSTLSARAQQELVSDGIENFELPKTLVTRIAKTAIPEGGKIQKEAVTSLVKGSTVFINYLAATAHDVATSKQHKSITAVDVLRALELVEFGDLVDPFQEELNAYRELAKTDKTKKGNASTVQVVSRSGPRNGPLGPSSRFSTSKGKEKAASASTAVAMDVDGEEPSSQNGVAGDEAQPPDEEDAQDDNDNDGGPREPVEDVMVLDEADLRRDALGLDDGMRHRDNDADNSMQL